MLSDGRDAVEKNDLTEGDISAVEGRLESNCSTVEAARRKKACRVCAGSKAVGCSPLETPKGSIGLPEAAYGRITGL